MSDAVLRKNLAALAVAEPELARRVGWPCASEHVAWAEDGGALLQVHREWHRLTLGDDEARAALTPTLGGPGALLLAGLGTGELLDAALRLAPGREILAWERDPWLLRQTLSRVNIVHALAAGRLRLLLGTDLLPALAAGPPGGIALHPLLAQIYTDEARWLGRPDPHGVPSPPLAAPRVLVAAGGLFVDDVSAGLREAGLLPVPFDTRRWSREELLRSATTLRPRALVVVNFVHGLPELCAEAGVPLLVWEIDPSTDALPPVPGGPDGAVAANTWIFTWRRAHVGMYAAAGYRNAAFLPLAANPRRRRPRALTPEEEQRVSCPVALVGSSMIEQGLVFRRRLRDAFIAWRGGDPGAAEEELDALVDGVLAAQREDLATFRVPALLAAAAPAFVAAAERGGRVFAGMLGASPAALLGEMAAADKRILYAANLGQVGLKVWGDAGWSHAEEYGAVWMGPAGHGEELTAIYNGGGIHVDVGRLYQSDIVTMRVFDVLACGGFCLAEWSEGLDELFAIGEELHVHRDLSELLLQVERWLDAGPDARAEAARRGRARVLRDHTIAARVAAMLTRAGLAPGAAGGATPAP